MLLLEEKKKVNKSVPNVNNILFLISPFVSLKILSLIVLHHKRKKK
jgi:hypothetical protein